VDIAQILTYISEHIAIIVAILVPLETLSILLLLVFAWRSGRQARRVSKLLQTGSGDNLEEMIAEFMAKAMQAEQERMHLSEQVDNLRQSLRPAIQRIGFHRFNAFPGVGGDLSFCIAVLDGDLNGFVLTSIFGREEARVYAKQIKGGQALATLSEEEQQAVISAKASL
jgi:HAMP domain-containing protein